MPAKGANQQAVRVAVPSAGVYYKNSCDWQRFAPKRTDTGGPHGAGGSSVMEPSPRRLRERVLSESPIIAAATLVTSGNKKSILLWVLLLCEYRAAKKLMRAARQLKIKIRDSTKKRTLLLDNFYAGQSETDFSTLLAV